MGIKIDLSTEHGQQAAIELANNMVLRGKKAIFQLVPEKRSLSQNDMIHAIYKQIAEQIQDQSIVDITRECKLRYGVPILRVQDERFKSLYDKAIKDNLSYEEKLDAMDILPVTRLMDTPQCTEYLESIIREYSKQGYCLAHPSEGL